MPTLPASTVIPQAALRPGCAAYGGGMRIAIRPGDTIRLAEGESMDRHLMRNLVHIRPDAALASDIAYKGLYFDTLDRLAGAEGFALNAASMFRVTHDRVISSQALLLRTSFESGEMDVGVGQSESTTPYKFFFGFTGDKEYCSAPGSHYDDATAIRSIVPVFLLDDRALAAMERAGIAPERIAGFFDGFMRLAALADHDYIHAITMPYADELPYHFASDDRDEVFYGPALEKHALATHAAVTAATFAARPARKAHVLRYARDSFLQIAGFQDDMRENAAGEAGLVANYLSQICAHRLFRVIDPRDLALAAVDAAIEAIAMHVPAARLDADSLYHDAMSNKEKLLLNLSTVDLSVVQWGENKLRPGMYDAIHDCPTVDLRHREDGVWRPHGLMDVLDDMRYVAAGGDPDFLYRKGRTVLTL